MELKLEEIGESFIMRMQTSLHQTVRRSCPQDKAMKWHEKQSRVMFLAF
jgi:hypothetical protein